MCTGMASLMPDVLERVTAAPIKAAEVAPASGKVDLPVLPKPVQKRPEYQERGTGGRDGDEIRLNKGEKSGQQNQT